MQAMFRRSASGTGAGLGLALARSIVLLHGGRIAVESTLGRGTCFHVYLPLVSIEHRTPTTEHRPGF